MLLIFLRIWHLSVVQHERKLEGTRRAQRKVVIERPERGTVRDRFGEVLATNRLQYSASLVYAPIGEIPYRGGKRKAYVEQLAGWLGGQLGMEPSVVEDLIYAKAAPLPHVPCVVKEGLSEEQYYRLRGAQRDWPGLVVERVPVRVYPRGKVACQLLGHIGAVGAQQMESMARELGVLKNYLALCDAGESVAPPEGISGPYEARVKWQELQERAFTAVDLVGRSGIEARFDRELRGYRGQQVYWTDAKGRRLGMLPGSAASLPGKQVMLTISAELQEFAEQLLSHNERLRDGRSVRMTLEDRAGKHLRQPYIKGGAIIALDPNTGELLACASYPRFDPNDFIQRKPEAVHKWLEDEEAITAIWDGHTELEREIFDWKKQVFELERKELTWEAYLDLVLPEEHPARVELARLNTVGAAVRFQQQEAPEPKLAAELCQLLVDATRISQPLLDGVGSVSMAQWRGYERSAMVLARRLEQQLQPLFHKQQFEPWRKQHSAAFLKEQRSLERAQKRAAKPYTDHLQQEERRQFRAYYERQWIHVATALLLERPDAVEIAFSPDPALRRFCQKLGPALTAEFLTAVRSYKKLNQREKQLAAAFVPSGGFGYGRSYAFQDATPQGSIFKLMPAYAALIETYQKHPTNDPLRLNPLTIIDDPRRAAKGWDVGRRLSGEAIPQFYKGGRLPRTASLNMGQIDLVHAIEISSNPYFGMLAIDVLKSPNDLARAARLFSYGKRTGIDLPGELSGQLPGDLETNRTGLYSTTMGQHTLLVTPIQAAVALSAISNGGHLLRPLLVKQVRGQDRTWSLSNQERVFAYWRPLSLIGVDFPLFTAAVCDTAHDQTVAYEPEVRWDIAMPEPVRTLLLEGMRRVIQGEKGPASPGRLRSMDKERRLLEDYIAIQKQLVGKSSSAEKREVVGLADAEIYKHCWFAAISFDECEPMQFGRPELVVIVYLRYGDFGKEAAPLAGALIKKWREIKQRE